MNYQTFLDTLHGGDFVYLIGDNPTDQVHISYHEKAIPNTGIKAGYSFYSGGSLMAHSYTKGKAIDILDKAMESGYTVKY